MKTHTTLSLDVELKQILDKKGIGISEFVDKLIRRELSKQSFGLEEPLKKKCFFCNREILGLPYPNKLPRGRIACQLCFSLAPTEEIQKCLNEEEEDGHE